MSEILTLKASASALISDEDGYLDSNNHSAATIDFTNFATRSMLVQFPPLPDGYDYREFLGATLKFNVSVNFSLSASRWVYFYPLVSAFNVDTVSGRNFERYDRRYAAYENELISPPGYSGWLAKDFDSYAAEYLLKYGAELHIQTINEYGDRNSASTAYGSNPPELVAVFSDPVPILPKFSFPLAGRSLNPNKDCRFSLWMSSAHEVADTLKPIALYEVELQWKVKGSNIVDSIVFSADALDIQKQGDYQTADFTVPGGTFSTGDIEYRFMLTANSGAVTYSEWVGLVTPTPELSFFSPASGARLNRLSSNYFNCLIRANPEGNSTFLDGQSGGVLRWRIVGDSANEVPLVNPYYRSAFIPGGTLPSGSIEYQLSIIDELGRTVETPWVTVSTVDTISTARVETPAGSVEDGERDIVFRWAHINESGTQASKSELQAARPGEAFSTFATIYGSATEHSAPAKSFASGEWQWRVRTYNIDDAAGTWSEAASFVVIASPQTPVVLLEDEGPRPEIRWQTNEQEGYELELDGVSLGTRFGPVQRWTSPDYLENGQHSFRVRVQNVYGLWSDWGMLVFTVANDASAEITLQGKAGREAKLQWQASGFDFYIIYRNGVPIGKTAANQWTDLFAIDKASYRVRGCYKNSDNYGISQELHLEVLPESLIIQAVSKLGSEDWISLRLSQSQHRVTKSSRGRSVNTMQLIGSKYPVAEPEEFESLSIQISCAFMNREECRALEDLTGKLVCVKTPYGDMAVGYLQNLSKSGEEFYSSYNFSVQHLELEEAIDIDA